jgi:hypothetical protein
MVAVMALMIGAGLSGLTIVLFMAVMFMILLEIDGLFLWQLSRLKTQVNEAVGAVSTNRTEPNELGAKREQGLLEPRMTVTEGTTRALTYEERKRK